MRDGWSGIGVGLGEMDELNVLYEGGSVCIDLV